MTTFVTAIGAAALARVVAGGPPWWATITVAALVAVIVELRWASADLPSPEAADAPPTEAGPPMASDHEPFHTPADAEPATTTRTVITPLRALVITYLTDTVERSANCPVCAAVVPRDSDACPVCGHRLAHPWPDVLGPDRPTSEPRSS